LGLLTGGSGSASATITGGTGSFAGYTGSFPTLAGSSASAGAATYSFNFTGSGTLNTSGGGTTTPTPTITSVQDAANNTANIALGSIFIVKGSNLSPSGYTPFGIPRPTTSGGVAVNLTPVAGGSPTSAYLVYLYNQSGVNQIACILPSTLSPGPYNVTVTNGSAVSAAVATTVVASKPALFTQDQTGTGLAVVQNYISQTQVDLNRLTTGSFNGVTISPAKPGQTLIAWGTGLGGYAAGDNVASPVHDFSTAEPITAIVNGVSIPVAFAGRAGYAGEDQINFTLPANIPTGCVSTLQLSVNGVLSGLTYISIAPSTSATACVLPGYTSDQLMNFDKGGTLTIGGFSLLQLSESVPSFGTGKFDSVSGGFTQITGFQLGSAAAVQASVIASGSCRVVQVTVSGTQTVADTATNLDAGSISITGPSGSNLTNQKLTEDSYNYYNYTIGIEGVTIPGATANGSIVPGTYTLTGAGGKDVGSFNTSITLGTPLTLSGAFPTTVTESAGLTLNWTGGNASDVVEIVGSAGTTTGSGANQVINSTEFFCSTTAGQKTFTVPASILTQMPTGASANGSLQVFSGPTPTSFSPSLTAGGTIASTFDSFIGTGGQVVYQ
jgi:uncharacterized protein (TIGR03437 family)